MFVIKYWSCIGDVIYDQEMYKLCSPQHNNKTIVECAILAAKRRRSMTYLTSVHRNLNKAWNDIC